MFVHVQTSTKRAVETTGVTKSFGWDSSEGGCGCLLSYVMVMWWSCDGVCSVAAT